jgi:hypothetical protein
MRNCSLVNGLDNLHECFQSSRNRSGKIYTEVTT